MLGLAARVWRHAGLAAATSDALVKLQAAGLSFDREQLDQRAAHAGRAEEPAFEAMWQATVHRTPVRFDYRRAGQQEAAPAHLQPWGVVTAQGRWYVVGPDPDRGEPRMFRLSRVASDVTADGEPGSYAVPGGHRPARAVARPGAPPARPHARGARPGRRRHRPAPTRRGAAPPASTGPDGTLGWDQLEVPYGSEPTSPASCWGTPTRWCVEAPAELRDLVVERLPRLLAGGAS